MVQPICPHRPPAPPRLTGHPPAHLQAGSPRPSPFSSQHAPEARHPLCPLYRQGHFSSSAPHRGCPPQPSAHHVGHRDSWTCAHIPIPSGLPVHPQIAWPVLAHFTPCLLSAVATGFLGDYQNPDKEGQSCIGWTEHPPVSHVSPGTSADVSFSPEAAASAPPDHPSSNTSAPTPSTFTPVGLWWDWGIQPRPPPPWF